jgi:hypothetical protein
MEQQTFRIRCYSKQELAQLYYPESTPRVAVNRLARWIKADPMLAAELAQMGYHKAQHDFRASQVRILVKYLGEP